MSTTSSSAEPARLSAARLQLVAEFSLDAYLLAKALEGSGATEGRHWERTLGGLLQRPSLLRRQTAGLMTLFEVRAASGANHEIDAAADGILERLLIEGKATGGGVTKADVAVFHAKSFDYFCAWVGSAPPQRWWRLLVSGTRVSDSVRKMCLHLGILLCEPRCLPLPVLLRAASRPSADLSLSEPLVREAVRLMEPAVICLEDIWRYDARSGEICFRPRWLSAATIADTLYIQEELSAALLDLYERKVPDRLPRRMARLLNAYARAA